MKKECRICNSVVSDILTHLYLDHEIKSAEEYEERATLIEQQLKKTEKYQEQVRNLVDMIDKKEITVEEYRERISNLRVQ